MVHESTFHNLNDQFCNMFLDKIGRYKGKIFAEECTVRIM